MLNKKCAIIPFLIGILFTAKAQNSTSELRQVVPPSPNVASLGKYGDIPVSLYTGIPNISIPLYEIKEGGISLPISLSYHSGGTKVEEIPSSVGLGWTLNAGGVVGRNVRGIQDELGLWYPQPTSNTVEGIMATGNTTNIIQLANDVYNRYRDGEPDIYYYNFNGQSGKFFYDQAGGIHTYPSVNILATKIAPDGWKIIAEDGTVYTFANAEEIASSGCNEGEDQNTISAWYLTSIKSSDGKRQITFTYESVWIVSTTLLGQSKSFFVNATGSGSCLHNQPPCLGTNQARTHRLTRIDFTEGYVKFSYNNTRCDLVDDKSLDVVEVFTKNNDPIKIFSFVYSYFGNNADGVNRLTENSKRLKLLSLTESNASISKPSYVFSYEESIVLPSRLSYAQDHWGYFNGKLNNADLIATFTAATPSGLALYPGADRKANTSTTQAAILKKITYPTGGESLFTYENNTVSDDRVEYDYTEQTIYLSATTGTPVDAYPNPFESSTSFTIPSGGATVSFNVTGIDSWPWQGCDIVQLQVIKDNNPTPYTWLTNSLNGASANWPAGTYKLRMITECGTGIVGNFSASVTARIMTSQSLTIRTAGGLRIKQIEDKPGAGQPSIIKNYLYHPDGDLTHSSGVLINFPDYGHDQTLDEYITDPYNPSAPLEAIGQCHCRVRQSFSNYPLATSQGSFVGYSHVIVDEGNNGESRHSFVAYENFLGGSFPFAPVESFDWRRGFETNIKYYAKKNNQLSLIKEVINTPYGSNEFRVYGLKTGKDYFNVINGAIAQNKPGYLWLTTQPVYQSYPTITEFYNIGKTVQKDYDQNDPTKFVETVKEYTYNPTHFQLSQIKTVTSKSDALTNEEILNNRKYPFDYTFSGTPSGTEAQGIKKLQDLHVVNAVIEETLVKQNRTVSNNQLSNQRVTGSSIITYKFDNPYPDQVIKLETTAPILSSTFGAGSGLNANAFVKNTNTTIANSYKAKFLFNAYDALGNISTQQKANDVKKSYLYDYFGVYPVAEAANAANTEIAYTSFEADGTGNWNAYTGTISTPNVAPFPITGKKYYNLTTTATLSKAVISGQKYIISYWRNSSTGGYTITGGTSTVKQGLTINGWTYYEHLVTATSTTLTLTGTGGIDEVRLYPSSAQMTTYTYEPLVGITSACDVNNRVTYYEYDTFQRLLRMRDQDGNILKTFDYKYQQ